jgi:hypothetical protein
VRSGIINVQTHNLAVVVDPESQSLFGAGERGNDGTEHSAVIKKTMFLTPTGRVEPHNLAPIVDPMELGSNNARKGDIDRAESPLVIDKAVLSGTISVETHNLAAVDPDGCGLADTGEGDVDGGEGVTVMVLGFAANITLNIVCIYGSASRKQATDNHHCCKGNTWPHRTNPP